MSKKLNYVLAFRDIFSAVPDGASVTYFDVINDPRLPANVSEATKRNHLRKYIEIYPESLRLVTGIIPKPETIIQLIETEIGTITEENLDDANQRASHLVSRIIRPIVDSFIRESLSDCYYQDDQRYIIPSERLLHFLLDDFAGHLKATGNGLVSIAGSLNEKLLQQAMLNAGLLPNQDFSITGTDSEADIVVHSSAGLKTNLGIEVKSYHARERLLRGLKDVKEPKIGAGFFKNPSEFNHGRTVTLLQANPAAIYMPVDTLVQVEEKARKEKARDKIAYGSALYRPLQQFVSDMKNFVSTGRLPHYDP